MQGSLNLRLKAILLLESESSVGVYQVYINDVRLFPLSAWTYSYQLQRLNNMPVVGSSLEWTDYLGIGRLVGVGRYDNIIFTVH